MSEWKSFFNHQQIRLIDHSNPTMHASAMDDFAIDDALALSVSNQSSPPVIRFWVHDKTVVLGIPDARIPYKNEAITYLKQQEYQPVVRNSGGLAVVLDKGVLNFSILLPGGNKLGIHEGYEVMVSLIRGILKQETDEIEAYEVIGSYCPGEYDLSINGKKFAGISQRRVRDGVAVQIYISIEGSGQERAELIQQFYQTGVRGEETKFHYPTIQPDTMRSLSQLLNTELTVSEFKQMVTDFLTTEKIDWIISELSNEEKQTFDKRKQQMVDRNQKALGDLF
ncbi:octanoyl-[GcvH]:protein N-octanoyltransferase [Paraliobacillus ryukyuensis]|uniref:Octanoyl-[GcvH]:protein N-octanoyltransferase n=1 Tax=Paraliobacillus ryukyuensis TaxID=200904 RepID=A0A366EDW5_9BACI|nr:lipoate--protein ligase family protein [Paraliobacillus ryukyuensis]RBP00508.1 octanoyl-[GcvH]:protein N-octanoyltransferase/lipoyl amidotransferase [Paraliobacillus ryukyuensis]